MAESASANDGIIGRPAKRIKVAGRVSHGTPPFEFVTENTETMIFDIHHFTDLNHKKDQCFLTESIQACGHLWNLMIYPRGQRETRDDTEYVSIFLFYSRENNEKDSALAKYSIRTKTLSPIIDRECKYSKERRARGPDTYSTRKEISDTELNKDDTLTIEVDIVVATKKRDIWYPKLNTSNSDYDFRTKLYRSVDETYDVTFIVGPSKNETKAHKNVLAVQARDLYELVMTEEQSSSSSAGDDNDMEIILSDVDVDAFVAMMRFCYIGTVPTFKKKKTKKKKKKKKKKSDDGDDDDDDVDGDDDKNEAKAKNILLVADRFRCTDLKMYMESYIVETILVPSNAARWLLVADSHACALLKEASMNAYLTDSNTVMTASHDDWNKLKESNDLLVELLMYSTSGGRKKYSSVVDDGDGTANDADGFDVVSLRERLEKYILDVDGSKDILLKRWKGHLLHSS